MQPKEIISKNKNYWDENADSWFGTTALPTYGVKFVSEDDLHFFRDISGKKALEICCGSGHSLKYALPWKLIWTFPRTILITSIQFMG